MPEKTSFAKDDFKVEVSKYIAQPAAKSSILILPPTGGTNTLDRRYAELFCESGFDVYLLDSWTPESESNIDFGLHQRFYERGRKAVLLVTNEIQTAKVGLMGTSVGALYASVAAATNERINALFLVVGGLPLSEVIVTSDQKAMHDLREQRAAKYGVPNEKQSAEIERNFLLEPTKQPGEFFKKQKIGMALALEDTTVATSTQQYLRKSWKPETVIELENGHFWSILKTWLFHRKEIVDFFKRNLDSP